LLALVDSSLIEQDERIGFGRRMLRIGMAWRRELDNALRGYGLTDARWRPILVLGARQTPMRQGDLVRFLVMDAPSVARLLESLERDGLIERVEDANDRRSKLVTITAAGRDLHRQVSAVAEQTGDRLLAEVSPEELAVCRSVFARLERALQKSAEPAAAAEEPDVRHV